MRRVGMCLLAVWAAGASGCAAGRGLDIYFIDMVGGGATLIVTPERESILVDSGQAIERDAGRIEHVVRDVAGLSRIDHVVTTHWHADHYGAIGPLDGRVGFGTLYDGGIPAARAEDSEKYTELIAAYKRVSGGQSKILVAGDEIALKQVNGPPIALRCLMASAKLPSCVPEGCETNPHCGRHVPKPPDKGENGLSVVLLLSYGDFDFFNPGDVTWNLERDLVCPVNRVGRVELFQVSHHGLPVSNNPVLVHALQPKVAITCNGPKKGGAKEVVATFRSSPGLEDLWQLHRNAQTSEADQPPRCRTANWDAPEGGQYIRASVAPSGRTFTVRVGADGEAVRYTCWR